MAAVVAAEFSMCARTHNSRQTAPEELLTAGAAGGAARAGGGLRPAVGVLGEPAKPNLHHPNVPDVEHQHH